MFVDIKAVSVDIKVVSVGNKAASAGIKIMSVGIIVQGWKSSITFAKLIFDLSANQVAFLQALYANTNVVLISIHLMFFF